MHLLGQMWQGRDMSVYVISGDAGLISLELTTLLNQLIGDEDRSMMLEDLDASDSATTSTAIADALHTLPMFTERRVVLVHEDGLQRISVHTLAYLNRLSSVLFALARYANHVDGVKEEAPTYR